MPANLPLRNKGSGNITVYIDPLVQKEQNAICCIKLLLIVALRSGQLDGDIARVLEETAQRQDRTIQWRFPNRPVLPALATVSRIQRRHFEKPARSLQLSVSFKLLGIAAGALVNLRSHDSRRGALRDIAHLDPGFDGANLRVAQLAAGHKSTPTTKDYVGDIQEPQLTNMIIAQHAAGHHSAATTADYIGETQHTSKLKQAPLSERDRLPLYNLRAESNFVDEKAPRFAASSFPAHLRRTTTAELDRFVEAEKENLGHIKEKRHWAREAIVKQRLTKWMAEQKSTKEDCNVQRPVQKCIRGHGRTLTEEMLSLALPAAREAALGKQPGHPVTDCDPSDDDDDEPQVDETDVQVLSKLVSALDDDRTVASAGEDVLLTWECVVPKASLMTSDDPLLLPPDSFVSYFASININKYCKAIRQGTTYESSDFAPRGNSLLPPQRFLFFCGKGQCSYSVHNLRDAVVHMTQCKGSPIVPKPFACFVCGLQLGSKEAVNKHMKHQHGDGWTPRPCPRCPLDPIVIFSYNKEYSAHMKTHELFQGPIQCPRREDGCLRPDALYSKRSTLRQHLRSHHGLTSEQASELYPDMADDSQPNPTGNFQLPPKPDWKCPSPKEIKNCRKMKKDTTNDKRREHLEKVHHWTDEQILEAVPLDEIESAIVRAMKEVARARVSGKQDADSGKSNVSKQAPVDDIR